MRSLHPLLISCLLSACASSAAGTKGAANGGEAQRVAIYTDASLATVYKDPSGSTAAPIAKSPAATSAAVRAAYANIGVLVTIDERNGARIGNADFYRVRTFAGKSMPELLSCGTGMTGPNAASYRIYMSLITTVEADGKGGSTARVQFSATAQNIAGGTSNDRVSCGSTGVLEQLLLTKIASV